MLITIVGSTRSSCRKKIPPVPRFVKKITFSKVVRTHYSCSTGNSSLCLSTLSPLSVTARSTVIFLEPHQSATAVGIYDPGSLPSLVCVALEHGHIPLAQSC